MKRKTNESENQNHTKNRHTLTLQMKNCRLMMQWTKLNKLRKKKSINKGKKKLSKNTNAHTVWREGLTIRSWLNSGLPRRANPPPSDLDLIRLVREIITNSMNYIFKLIENFAKKMRTNRRWQRGGYPCWRDRPRKRSDRQ